MPNIVLYDLANDTERIKNAVLSDLMIRWSRIL
jgi:hypothetical protein